MIKLSINSNYLYVIAYDDVEHQAYRILDCRSDIASANYRYGNTHGLLSRQGLEKNDHIRCIYGAFPTNILLSLIQRCYTILNEIFLKPKFNIYTNLILFRSDYITNYYEFFITGILIIE